MPNRALAGVPAPGVNVLARHCQRIHAAEGCVNHNGGSPSWGNSPSYRLQSRPRARRGAGAIRRGTTPPPLRPDASFHRCETMRPPPPAWRCRTIGRPPGAPGRVLGVLPRTDTLGPTLRYCHTPWRGDPQGPTWWTPGHGRAAPVRQRLESRPTGRLMCRETMPRVLPARTIERPFNGARPSEPPAPKGSRRGQRPVREGARSGETVREARASPKLRGLSFRPARGIPYPGALPTHGLQPSESSTARYETAGSRVRSRARSPHPARARLAFRCSTCLGSGVATRSRKIYSHRTLLS